MALKEKEQKASLLEEYHDIETSPQSPRDKVWKPLALPDFNLQANLAGKEPCTSRLRTFTLSIATCLLPSFVKVQSWKSEKAPKKLSSTAWLDGLRGVAAFFVVFTHYFHLFLPSLEDAWNIDSPKRSILQLPFIRIFHSGTAMVGVFFVISGYVLSYRALQLIRLDDPVSLHNSLASSTFRRAMRLFFPIVVSTFLAMLCTYFEWYGTGPGSRAPPRLPTFWENVIFWARETLTATDPFRVITSSGVYSPTYDTNLWTIPVEFRGSIIVFLMVLGLSRAKPTIRILILLGMVIYCISRIHSDISLFVGGVFLADLHHFTQDHFEQSDHIALDKSRPNNAPQRSKIIFKLLKIPMFSLSFILSIFLLGMPLSQSASADSPGYWILVSLTPQSYAAIDAQAQLFWVIIGAHLCVWTLDNATFLQSIFTTTIAQYLGRISYALYLVHGTLLYTLGWHMIPAFLNETSSVTSFFGHLFGGGLLFAVIVWVADIFTTGVDERSVKLVRYISQKCFVKF